MKRNGLFLITLTLAGCPIVFFSGCSAKDKQNNIYIDPNPTMAVVPEKYSLSADRKALDEVRKNIPQEKMQENDELAFMLSLTSEVKLPPNKVREQYDKLARKKRELFNSDMQKQREAFNKTEKKQRDEFLKNQDVEKKTFMKQGFTRDQKNDFYKDLDAKRTQYFSDEKERRADFESQSREKRKNFEDYYKEKNDTFNQEYRSYSKRYDEMKKQKREQEKLLTETKKAKSQNSVGQNGSSTTGEVPSFAAQVMGTSESGDSSATNSTDNITPDKDMAKLLIELEQEIAKSKSRVGTKLESGH